MRDISAEIDSECFFICVCVCSCMSSLTAAAPAPDATKRNLSAFCSDMLDEYLENEGKLLEQQSACSFSQPAVEPVAYQLPTSSCSYVRTLDSVLQLKQQQQPPAMATASQLMSAFVPPSKRPKVTLKETKMAAKRRAPRHTRTPDQDLGQDPLQDLEQEQLSPFKRRRRRRLKAPHPSGAPDHLAPLESDSELLEQGGRAAVSGGSGGGGGGEPGMTRALLKQQDLEDGVVWEGHPRTSITEQRASVALTSLFTLTVNHSLCPNLGQNQCGLTWRNSCRSLLYLKCYIE